VAGWVGASIRWNPARVRRVKLPSAACSIEKPGVCLALWSPLQPGHRFWLLVGPAGQAIRWSPSASVAGVSQPGRKQEFHSATTHRQIGGVGR
jgi:hypothetical protein